MQPHRRTFLPITIIIIVVVSVLALIGYHVYSYRRLLAHLEEKANVLAHDAEKYAAWEQRLIAEQSKNPETFFVEDATPDGITTGMISTRDGHHFDVVYLAGC